MSINSLLTNTSILNAITGYVQQTTPDPISFSFKVLTIDGLSRVVNATLGDVVVETTTLFNQFVSIQPRNQNLRLQVVGSIISAGTTIDVYYNGLSIGAPRSTGLKMVGQGFNTTNDKSLYVTWSLAENQLGVNELVASISFADASAIGDILILAMPNFCVSIQEE